jgi:hypothetical protein
VRRAILQLRLPLAPPQIAKGGTHEHPEKQNPDLDREVAPVDRVQGRRNVIL